MLSAASVSGRYPCLARGERLRWLIMPTRPKALTQAYSIQDICHEQVIALKDLQGVNSAEKALKIAALARAWCDITERVRIIRCKPAPKAIEVTQAGKPVKTGRKRGSISSSAGNLTDDSQGEDPDRLDHTSAPD